MKTIINTLIFILIFNYNYAQSEISGIIKNSSYASIDGANVIVKGTNYNPPTEYLFLDEKRKLKLVARVKKQITKFDLTKEELGFVIN